MKIANIAQKVNEVFSYLLLNLIYRFKTPSLVKQTCSHNDIKFSPKISIVIPTYNTPPKFLEECIKSVVQQTYDNYEICIVDDNSTNRYTKSVLLKYKKHPKIKIKFRSRNGNISLATNDGIKMSSGSYIGFLDHDDVLWPNALKEVASAINSKPNLKFIYSDQDKIDDENQHFEPFLKPEYNRNLLLSVNYINHFTVIEKKLIEENRLLQTGVEGAQDWDLFLRTTASLRPSQIHHIPKILYSWRSHSGSTASPEAFFGPKSKVFEAQKKVLEMELKRSGHLNTTPIMSRYLGIWNHPLSINITPAIIHWYSLKRLLNL